MHKKVLYTLSTAFLLSGLVACNTDEGARGDTKYYNDATRPIGYYSNENMDKENGNAYLLERDNDGPLTEIMDRTDTSFNNLENRFPRSDYNYHGQMATRNNVKKTSYYNNYEGRLAEQISNRIAKLPNVNDVRTLVTDHQVLIALDTNNRDQKVVRDQVRTEIERMTNGKTVRIVTDPATFTRVRSIDNEIQDGGPIEELNADVRDLFREMGNETENIMETPLERLQQRQGE